jgi:hypothetical protein
LVRDRQFTAFDPSRNAQLFQEMPQRVPFRLVITRLVHRLVPEGQEQAIKLYEGRNCWLIHWPIITTRVIAPHAASALFRYGYQTEQSISRIFVILASLRRRQRLLKSF